MSGKMLRYARKGFHGILTNHFGRTPAAVCSILSGSRSKATIAAEQVAHIEPRPASEIPGPRRWPIIASMPFIVNHKEYDKLRIFKVWEACLKEFGPVFRLDMPGSPPSVFISEPSDIEMLFKSTTDHHNKPVFYALKSVRDNHSFLLRDKSGILIEHSDEWWRIRRRVQPYTAKPKNVALYLSQMDKVALDFVERWGTLRDEKKELPSNFSEELYSWGLESLGLVIFNKRLGYIEGNPDMKKVIKCAQDIFALSQVLEFSLIQWWKLFETPMYKQLVKANDDLLGFVKDSVNTAYKSLEAREPDSDEDYNLVERLLLDDKLSFEDAHIYLMDLLTAGIDTTAMTVAYTLIRLAENPEKQAKLHAEIDEVLGDNTETLTTQKLANLKYTKACVKETLRLNSPAILTIRRLYKDTVLGGYTVPKGYNVNVLLVTTGKTDKHFTRGTEFLPERWLRHHPYGPINHHASIPFSSGLRNCVGRRLSEQESYTIIVRLLQKYRLEWHYGALDPVMNIVLTPDKPLRIRLIERR